jgi:hypothetical protein
MVQEEVFKVKKISSRILIRNTATGTVLKIYRNLQYRYRYTVPLQETVQYLMSK